MITPTLFFLKSVCDVVLSHVMAAPIVTALEYTAVHSTPSSCTPKYLSRPPFRFLSASCSLSRWVCSDGQQIFMYCSSWVLMGLVRWDSMQAAATFLSGPPRPAVTSPPAPSTSLFTESSSHTQPGVSSLGFYFEQQHSQIPLSWIYSDMSPLCAFSVR